MRHYVALYVGGMGSRKQNFYNALMRRYGFEDAARAGPGALPRGPQGRGRRGAAGRADRHASRLVGPRDLVRERLARLPRRRRRHADDLADGVDVRGAARPAARGGRAGRSEPPADLLERALEADDLPALTDARAGVRRDLPGVDAARLDGPGRCRPAGPNRYLARRRVGARRVRRVGRAGRDGRVPAVGRGAGRSPTSGSCSCTRRAGARGSPARCSSAPRREMVVARVRARAAVDAGGRPRRALLPRTRLARATAAASGTRGSGWRWSATRGTCREGPARRVRRPGPRVPDDRARQRAASRAATRWGSRPGSAGASRPRRRG